MVKKIIVKQDGYKECGAACLLSIIRYYGGNISINKLVELTCTNKEGTSFYNLKQAALKIGLDAKGFKITNNKLHLLKKMNAPSICQIINNNYTHFVVIYNINKQKITIMDPASGIKKIKIDSFFKSWTGYILIFNKRTELPYFKEEKYLSKVIAKTIIKNKSIVLNIIIISILFTMFSCIYAFYFQTIIDNIVIINKNNLLIVTTIFGIILLLKLISNLTRNTLLIYLNQKLDCSIFTKSFQKILLLPYSYYKNKTTGEIISRINDLVYVKNMLSKIILTVFLDFIISLVCGLVLLKINKTMFLLLMITILIYIIIFYIFKPILKKYININQENNAIINSNMIEMINGFATIKNLNMERLMNDKISSIYTNALNHNLNYEKINNLELFIKDTITYISTLIIEFIGFKLVFSNNITLGSLITFTTLITYFIEPIRNIIDLNTEYYYALNSLKRANNLFDIESADLVSKTDYNIQGNIKIKNLSYSYNDYKKILNNINITINKGEKVLLLGKSGSGKSTLIKILSKYYKPSRNTVYIDNNDINKISITNLKNNIITISQEEIIFTDTIKNNITLNRNIDSKEFMRICKLTYIEDITNRMFLGMDTKLEENGQNISGGQRQRIILARALLKPANIILIDEGLNAIDINLERKILKNIFNEYKDKTFIIVSHRTENMDLYDKIIKIEKGKEKILKKTKEAL